jgi:hypothetical protein
METAMTMRKIVNLTPHQLMIRRADGTEETIESSGIARCATVEEAVGEIDGIPVPQNGSSTRPPCGHAHFLSDE